MCTVLLLCRSKAFVVSSGFTASQTSPNELYWQRFGSANAHTKALQNFTYTELQTGDQVRAKLVKSKDGELISKYYLGTIRHCWPEEKGEEAQYDIAFETVLHDETQLHYKLVRGLDDKDGPKRDNFVHGERVKARARTAAGNVGDHYFEGVIATTTSSRNLASGNDLDIDYDRFQDSAEDYEDVRHWVQHRGVSMLDCERAHSKGRDRGPPEATSTAPEACR